MRKRARGTIFGLMIVLICSAAAVAQTKKAEAPAKTPAMSAKPDLSGVWMMDVPPATALPYWAFELNEEEPPLTPWGQEQFKANKSSFGRIPIRWTKPTTRSCTDVFRPACRAFIFTRSRFKLFRFPAKS